MNKEKKFKPEVTRIKLAPEQAILTCECYNTDSKTYDGPGTYGATIALVTYTCIAGGGKATEQRGFSCISSRKGAIRHTQESSASSS